MPTDAWFKANPKVSGYLPQVIYDCLMKFKDERGISISQAVTTVLSEYFGIDRGVNQSSFAGISLSQVQELEQDLASLAKSVEQRFQKLENKIELIVESLNNSLVDQSKPTVQSNSSDNEPTAITSNIIQAIEQDKGSQLATVSELLSKPLNEEIEGNTQTEWHDVNTVLLNELQSETLLEQSENEIDSSLEATGNFLVDEKELIPSIQPLSGVELSKRLKADRSVIARYKNGKRKQTLAEWSKGLDPDGVAWDYSEEQKKYIPINQSELTLSLQGELLKANSSDSKQPE